MAYRNENLLQLDPLALLLVPMLFAAVRGRAEGPAASATGGWPWQDYHCSVWGSDSSRASIR